MSELYFSAVADTIFPAVAALAENFVGILAQAAGDAAGDGAAGGEAAAGEGGGQAPPLFESLLRSPLPLLAGVMILFYVMIVLPERRKQTKQLAEEARLRAGLKKDDRVLTTGGIYGTVVATSPNSDDITLRIDDSNNTRIRVVRSAIATVLTPPKDETSG